MEGEYDKITPSQVKDDGNQRANVLDTCRLGVEVGDDRMGLWEGLDAWRAEQVALSISQLLGQGIRRGVFMVPGEGGSAFTPEQQQQPPWQP